MAKIKYGSLSRTREEFRQEFDDDIHCHIMQCYMQCILRLYHTVPKIATAVYFRKTYVLKVGL